MDQARNNAIARLARRAVDDGHCVIVLSDRISQLNYLLQCLPMASLYIGKTTQAERERVERESSVLLSTYSLAREGLDIPRLSCLILATPKAEIEQSVGRIQRPCPGKMSPVVFDVIDGYSVFGALRWRRQRFYKCQKYDCRVCVLT